MPSLSRLRGSSLGSMLASASGKLAEQGMERTFRKYCTTAHCRPPHVPIGRHPPGGHIRPEHDPGRVQLAMARVSVICPHRRSLNRSGNHVRRVRLQCTRRSAIPRPSVFE